MPRSHLLFTRIRIDGVPARQRMDALRLELEQNAPFEDVAGWVIWQGGLACVWYWSKELESSIGADSQQAKGHCEYVPETVLWPQLESGHHRWVEEQGDALVLIQYQHPQQGLYEKRYPGPITREEVAAWLQRHGARDVTADKLVAQPSPALSSPAGQGMDSPGSSLESRIFPLSAMLLGFFVVVYVVAIARAGLEAENAKQQAQQMQQSISDVVALRQKAASLKSQAELLAEFNVPSQVEVAAQLAELLDVQGGRLVRWAYRDGRLELSWEPEGALPESTQVITTLEETHRFSNVQAQAKGGSLMEVSMQVKSSGSKEPSRDPLND